MKKDFIQLILMFFITSSITFLGFKDNIEFVTWYSWKLNSTADLLIWLFAAMLIVTIWAYVTQQKDAQLAFIMTPYLENIEPEIAQVSIIIDNLGDKRASEIEIECQLWRVFNNDIEFLSISNNELIDIKGKSHAVWRIGLLNKLLTEIAENDTPLVLFLEISYSVSTGKTKEYELFIWKTYNDNRFVFLKNMSKDYYNKYLTLIKRKSH